MTFNELRRYMRNKRRTKQVIRWNKSGIVEVAVLTKTGGILITNVVTNHSFRVPNRYKDIDITPLELTEMVTLGSLLPKRMR